MTFECSLLVFSDSLILTRVLSFGKLEYLALRRMIFLPALHLRLIDKKVYHSFHI